MNQPCQIAAPWRRDELPCPATDSRGVRCEATGPHEQHWVSDHTKEHERLGNGRLCDFRSFWNFSR